MFKKLVLLIVLFLGLITFAQAETSWIKKKDKTEKAEKKSTSWIKKKRLKSKKIKKNIK